MNISRMSNANCLIKISANRIISAIYSGNKMYIFNFIYLVYIYLVLGNCQGSSLNMLQSHLIKFKIHLFMSFAYFSVGL